MHRTRRQLPLRRSSAVADAAGAATVADAVSDTAEAAAMAAAAIASGAVALPDAGAVTAGTSIAAAAVAITTATASPVVATGPSCFASVWSFTKALSSEGDFKADFASSDFDAADFDWVRPAVSALPASRHRRAARYRRYRDHPGRSVELGRKRCRCRVIWRPRPAADRRRGAAGRAWCSMYPASGCRCPQRRCCRPMPQSCHCAPTDRKPDARISPKWPEKPRLRILLTGR